VRRYMLNKELVLEVLRQIEESAQKVINRFQVIDEPGNFTDSPTGKERYLNFLVQFKK
jgi:hypothetical protein